MNPPYESNVPTLASVGKRTPQASSCASSPLTSSLAWLGVDLEPRRPARRKPCRPGGQSLDERFLNARPAARPRVGGSYQRITSDSGDIEARGREQTHQRGGREAPAIRERQQVVLCENAPRDCAPQLAA